MTNYLCKYDEDVGFTHDMYDFLQIDELTGWDNNEESLKEAFLRGADYFKQLVGTMRLHKALNDDNIQGLKDAHLKKLIYDTRCR